MSTQPPDPIAELARQEAQQVFEIPDAVPLLDDVGPPPTFSHGGGTTRFTGGSESVKTLEDIYSAYPKIGEGEWKMRIDRVGPKSHNGHATAGIQGDVFERLSFTEFKDRFGGGTYTIQVIRPTGEGDSTQSDYKSVGSPIRFRIAGDPVVTEKETEHDRSSNVSSSVEIARMTIDERERQRLHDERRRAEDKAERVTREAIPGVYDAAKQVIEDSRTRHDAERQYWGQQLSYSRQEKENLEKDLRALEKQRNEETKKLNDELYELKQRANATTLAVETKVVSDMRVQYETRLSELKDQTQTTLREQRDRFEEERRRTTDEASKKLQDALSDHRRQVEDITRRHDEERRNYESAQSLERERIREETRHRTDQIEKSKEQEMRSLKETYDQRIGDLRSTTDRELQSIRDATMREIESIRQSEGVQTKLAKETSEMKRDMLRAEEQRIRGELEELRAENRELQEKLEQERVSKHKDPLTAIREAKEFGAELGLVEASGEKNETTGAQLIGLLKQGFDAAPQVLDKFMQARQQNVQTALQVQAQQFQQYQAQQQAQFQQPRQLQQQQQQPQGQQQQQQRRYAPPAAPMQQRGQVPFGAGGTGMPPSSPVPFAPAPVVMASPLQPQGQAGATGGGYTQFTQTSSPESQVAMSAAPPVAQEQPGQPQQQLSPAEQEGIKEFFRQLDSAITNKVISPETFAIALVDQVGPQQAVVFLQRYQPRDVTATAEALAFHAVATREGQKYVDEVWRRAAARAQQKLQEAGAGP